MAFRRPRDPKIQHDAAASMGKLVAQGVLEHGEALDALTRAAVAKAGPDINRAGLRARLSWALMDSADGWRRSRHWADLDIRRDIRPLLDERAPAQDIVRAAHAMNEARGEPLTRREVVEVVGQEIQAALRFMRTRGRRRVS